MDAAPASAPASGAGSASSPQAPSLLNATSGWLADVQRWKAQVSSARGQSLSTSHSKRQVPKRQIVPSSHWAFVEHFSRRLDKPVQAARDTESSRAIR